MKKMKAIECIAMQDAAALRIYESLKGASREEEMAYWRKREAELRVSYPFLRDDDARCAESGPSYGKEG